MPCSGCSIRTLGAFIFDLTGLKVSNIIQSRLSFVPAPAFGRHFSTRPPLSLRQSNHSGIDPVTAFTTEPRNDYYIPFDNIGTDVGTTNTRRGGALRSPSSPPLSSTQLHTADQDRNTGFSKLLQGSDEAVPRQSDQYHNKELSANDYSPLWSSQDSVANEGEFTRHHDPVLELSAASIEALSAELDNDTSSSSSNAEYKDRGDPLPQRRKPTFDVSRPATRIGLERSKIRRNDSSVKAASDNWTPPKREQWQILKASLANKFKGEAWNPRKRLSPDALEGIRALNAQYPERYTTPVLAAKFEVSPEVIRRILKSKWRPNEEEEEDRRRRWDKRGEKIWGQMVELGVKPPKKWRDMGIGKLEDGDPEKKRMPAPESGPNNVGIRSRRSEPTSRAISEYEPLGDRIL